MTPREEAAAGRDACPLCGAHEPSHVAVREGGHLMAYRLCGKHTLREVILDGRFFVEVERVYDDEVGSSRQLPARSSVTRRRVVTLNGVRANARELQDVLGTATVPVKALRPSEKDTYLGAQYLRLDVAALEPEQRERLIVWWARGCHRPEEAVRAHIDRGGDMCLPLYDCQPHTERPCRGRRDETQGATP